MKAKLEEKAQYTTMTEAIESKSMRQPDWHGSISNRRWPLQQSMPAS
jgi:hypothetical protein